MVGSKVSSVHYAVNRWTVTLDSTPKDFCARFEQAVPPVPRDAVLALVQRKAPWKEMLDLVSTAAPFGFLVYGKLEFDPVMHLAGNEASCATYLMGNHTIAERMFRYEPAVMLYAPLHVTIWGPVNGPTHFTFDQPSDEFGSFGNPQVAAVGVELDHKVAALLKHLGAAVPDGLLAK
jgi:hypothetical protein